MILPVPIDSFNSYRDNPRQVLQVERRCQGCKTRSLSHHGSYLRWVYFLRDRERILLFRLRCRPCRLTVTLLPEFLLPYVRYALGIVEASIDAAIGGMSRRTVAVVLSGVKLPPGHSVTDALTWLKIAPSYQRVHAWLKAAISTATTGIQAAAAWLIRHKPDSLAVELLTAPIQPSPRRHKHLTALSLLVRLFTTDPNLNPRRVGWLTAWHRFSSLILPRRNPPREPQTS
jgi:hypothetical protein